MKPQAGPPVTGENFFNRDAELRLLDAKVRGGTHVLLAGQRRMGKTSVARELGRRLRADGWAFLFVDVENAASPSDIIRDIAKAAHAITGASRLTAELGRWFKENFEELSAQGTFSVGARRALERIYSSVLPNARERVDEALDVLVHDGHLERTDAGHRLAFRLLEDWLRTRFSDHHVPLQQRIGGRH